MTKWQVELTGERFDLEELPSLFTSPDFRVLDEEGAFYLESSVLDVLEESGAVSHEAERILPILNGAAKLKISNYRNVELGSGIVEIDATGRRRHQVIRVGAAETRAKAFPVTVRLGGVEPVPPAPGTRATDKWVELAAQDSDVAEALATLGSRPHDWFNLYKVFEIIQSRADFKGNGWASDKEVSRFTWTANHPEAGGDEARHARLSQKPPARPMTLGEGDAFVAQLLTEWLCSLL
ncbi:MAG: hypothetical protein ACRDHS_10835 [Actinomycetota bacterium]